MKVAIVHDQLREFGGAERVLVALKKIFPTADVFTSTYDPGTLGTHKNLINQWNISVSWFGKIPVLNKLYSPLRFLTPFIWESFDFSRYDLVISSSGSWMCKGIKTKHPTMHISYVHHPPRYLYGYETAIEWQKYLPIKIYGNFINHFLRIWDCNSTKRPDYLIANSQETQKRIRKFYRRTATVIYPPVNIPTKIAALQFKTENYYITVSRLARAKHVDVLIKAANQMKFRLKIVGSGRDEQYLRSVAGSTVEFLGNISDQKLAELYKRARAFIFSSVDEEFGIAPVEAMGYALPVIAYRSGGLPETVTDGINGYLYTELSPESLLEKIKLLESLPTQNYITLKNNARKISENFTEKKFKERVLDFIAHTVSHR